MLESDAPSSRRHWLRWMSAASLSSALLEAAPAPLPTPPAPALTTFSITAPKATAKPSLRKPCKPPSTPAIRTTAAPFSFPPVSSSSVP